MGGNLLCHIIVAVAASGGGYFRREIPLERDDMALMYTDGLAEARRGEEQARDIEQPIIGGARAVLLRRRLRR